VACPNRRDADELDEPAISEKTVAIDELRRTVALSQLDPDVVDLRALAQGPFS